MRVALVSAIGVALSGVGCTQLNATFVCRTDADCGARGRCEQGTCVFPGSTFPADAAVGAAILDAAGIDAPIDGAAPVDAAQPVDAASAVDSAAPVDAAPPETLLFGERPTADVSSVTAD